MRKSVLFVLFSFLSVVVHGEEIRGRVTDSNNQPLANIKVCLIDINPDSLGGLVPPGSVLSAGCKTTVADGSYSLSAFKGHSYVAQIDEAHVDLLGLNLVPEFHTGERTGEKSVKLVSPLQITQGDLANIDFQLEEGFRIKGIVTDHNGAAVSGVYICLQSSQPGGSNRCIPPDATGRYSTQPLPRGDYLVFTITQGKYVDEFHTGNATALAPVLADNFLKLQGEVNGINFTLHPGYAANGVIRDLRNQPLATSSVCVSWIKPDNSNALVGCIRAVGGTYQTPRLPAGSYLLFVPDSATHFGAYHNGQPYGADTEDMPALVLASNDLQQVNFTLPRAIRLSGQVRESSGRLLAGANVCYFRFDSAQEQPRNISDCLQSDASGNYRSELLPEGQFVMSASTSTHASVGHDGTVLAPGQPVTTLVPFSATQDSVFNFVLSGDSNKFQNITATQLSSYWIALDTSLKNIPLSELVATPSQKTVATLTTALAEIPPMADAMRAHIAKGTMTDYTPLRFTASAASALNLSMAAIEKGAAISADDFIRSVNAIAKVLAATTIYDEKLNVIYGDKTPTLYQVLEGSLRSSTRLFPYLKTEAQVMAAIDAMEQMLNTGLHQSFQIESPFKELIESFMRAAATAGRPYALTSTGGTAANDEQIRTALRQNPALLMRHLARFALELDYPLTYRMKVADNNLLASGVPIPSVSAALDFHESISDSFELIWLINPQPYPIWQLEEALQSVMPGATVNDHENKLLVITPTNDFMSAVASNIRVVSPLVPEGFFIAPDGSALVISESLAITYIPTANSFTLALRELSSYGPVTFHPNGGVTFRFNGQTLAATFSFGRERTNANPVGTADLLAPANIGSNDPNSIFILDYQQKAVEQRLAPFITAQAFYDSLLTRGVSYKVARDTGVITVGERRLRPAFQVTLPSAEELGFYQQYADTHGVAIQSGDFNGDGLGDYRVITDTSSQLVYGLP